MNRPNIVFFMVDQLSAKWLEVALGGACNLPNIRRLMGEGVSFRNVITSNPVCCPARATLATGMTSRGHGVLENGYSLSPELPTFMRVLQQAGWRTGAFGKLHFQPHFAGLHPDYRPYGFDVTHITEDSRGGDWLDWVMDKHPEHLDQVLATIWCPEIPEFETYGRNRDNLSDRIRAVRKSFKWFTDDHPKNTDQAYTLPFPEHLSQTAWITDHALDFIRATPDETPVYAHISYVQPHAPSCPPADFVHMVNPECIPKSVPPEWLSDPNAPGYFSGKTPDEADWEYRRLLYFADMAHLDSKLGLVLDCLEETGRRENALIVFLADHGDLLGDHGFYGKEERHYDACIRVPLVIAGTSAQRGIQVDDFAQIEDLCPTVLEAAGVDWPLMPKQGDYLKKDASDIASLPGRSLLPLCRGNRPEGWRQEAYCESYNAICSDDLLDWARTIRTRRYRYTWYPDNGEQLFDLAQDPDEQQSRASDPAFADVRRDLRDRLMKLVVMQDYPKTRRDLFALGVH